MAYAPCVISIVHADDARLFRGDERLDVAKSYCQNCSRSDGRVIINPTKVVRVALENVVSVASVLLLTEATMTEVPDEKKAPAV